MTKQVNANIGHVGCHLCGEVAALRKNKNGSLYYDCLNCGRITPNHAGGQAKIKDTANIWGPIGAPKGTPRWIAEQWPYAVAIRNRDGATVPHGGAGKATAPGGQKAAPEPPAATGFAAGGDPPAIPDVPPPPPEVEPKKSTGTPAPKATPKQPEPVPATTTDDDWLDEL